MELSGFDAFIADFPVYEYRILDTEEIRIRPAVRTICASECRRYGSSWACPPGVGTLEQCEAKIREYPRAVFFSSVAEVTDLLHMEEMLATRSAHEDLTDRIGTYLRQQGLETFILSTESCSVCETCTYPHSPCRFPQRMHPCLESYGVVVTELAERESMEYDLGGGTILWFSMILFRPGSVFFADLSHNPGACVI